MTVCFIDPNTEEEKQEQLRAYTEMSYGREEGRKIAQRRLQAQARDTASTRRQSQGGYRRSGKKGGSQALSATKRRSLGAMRPDKMERRLFTADELTRALDGSTFGGQPLGTNKRFMLPPPGT